MVPQPQVPIKMKSQEMQQHKYIDYLLLVAIIQHIRFCLLINCFTIIKIEKKKPKIPEIEKLPNGLLPIFSSKGNFG